MIQTLTLRTHSGADGQLHLDIPTTLPEKDFDVIVLLKLVPPPRAGQNPPFSERWRGKFKGLHRLHDEARTDLRLQYLLEHYKL